MEMGSFLVNESQKLKVKTKKGGVFNHKEHEDVVRKVKS
jgi:hypothetical protein